MDNDNSLNVQNGFFNQIRKDRVRVTVTLNSGQRVSGMVKSFDKFTFLLDTRTGEQMIFKHAVSTIAAYRAPEPGKVEKREAQGFGNFIDFEGKKE
ncbi:MAG TPA: RNA chaperone Hfq [Candidatus Polarisedimenticolia bacterium]|nr:RNA chaperone Hfq [Candidatus Polarisedimenticolia bacterium]